MAPSVVNLHNHTPFSDGAYTIDELCEAHLKLKDVRVEGIGICDHLFCTPSSRKVEHPHELERVFGSETRSYVREVRAAQARWEGRLNVYLGCEIHWPLNKPVLDTVRGMVASAGLDYVLFECIDWAALTQLANQARRWPCPVGVAHVNVTEQFPNTTMEQVVRTMANARIFYEINSKILPLDENDAWFALLPKHKVMVSIGTDTHDDLSRLGDLRTMIDYVERRGLGGKLVKPERAEMRTAASV
jgi:histidinol phosphatase-like PHP family hydrolase